MAWIKLFDSFTTHPKFRRLAKFLSVETVTARGHMATLWAWSLTHAPDGDLADFTVDEIAYAAEWKGDPEIFFDALHDSGLLDVSHDSLGTVRTLHNFYRNNENFKRSQQKANLRQRKRQDRGQSRDSPETVCPRREETRRDEQRRDETSREENIYLETVEEPKKKKRSKTEVADEDFDRKRGDEVRAVFEHYRTYHSRAHLKPHSDQKEWKKIRSRLRDGYTVDDLKLAIDGNHRSRFHQGENEDARRYDSLELIVRDSSKVTQFMEYATREDPKRFYSKREKNTAQMIEDLGKQAEDHAASLPPYGGKVRSLRG